MVWVNLLPWRRQQLLLRLRRSGLLITALLAVFIVAVVPLADQQQLSERQQQQIQQLKEANSQFEKLKARLSRLAQQKEQLRAVLAASVAQRQRFQEWHAFMLSLADLLPATLWLSEITKTSETLTVTGFCLRMAEADVFRQRLQSLPLFRQVKTARLNRDGQGVIHFSLAITLDPKGGGHE